MKPDFEGLLRVLDSGGMDFVLVGGYSAMLHGSSLMTRDIDVVCPMSLESVGRLFAILEPFHPHHRMDPSRRSLTKSDCERQWSNLYLGTDLGVLDCLGEVKGIGDFEACLARSIEIDLGDFTVRGLSLEALIEAKRAMGRPRDLHTAEELEMIRERRGP